MRALVVDDSRAMRALLTNILQSIGAEVTQAKDGCDALARLRSADRLPDLMLVDWHMPEMDGLELIKQVRKDPAWKPMTLMMVTTESEHENMVRALLAGADEYLIKPFTRDALLEKLNLLGVRVPEQALAARTGG